MGSMDSFETTLRTCITLTAPDAPLERVSVFGSGEPEEALAFPALWVEGRLDALQSGRGLGIINTAFTSGEQEIVATLHAPTRPTRFSFALSPGPTSVSLAGERRSFDFAGGQSAVLSVPSPLVNVVPPHRRFHNLCILIDASFMESCLGEISGRAASGLTTAMETGGAPYSHISAISPCIQMVIEQICSCAYVGSLKRFYLEAKCMELVTMRLHELCNEPPLPARPPLRSADVERIHEARELLIERSADPPSLHEIAVRVGVNCNKLKYGFREVFGTTVFGYLRKLRLEQARRLLEDGDHSVTEVAFEVGYNSLSHFARVFKETYGTSPHCYSRQCAATARDSHGGLASRSRGRSAGGSRISPSQT